MSVSLIAQAPSVESWQVRYAPPMEQGGMDENFYALVKKAWEASPRIFLGIRVGEFSGRGLKSMKRILARTAKAVGCANLDHIFPWIHAKKCRVDLREQLSRKERVVPVWMMISLLHNITGQFWKYNDRFRIVFDLMDELEEGLEDARLGIMDGVPGLVRESVILAARKGDRILEVYETGAVRAASDIPNMQAQIEGLQKQVQTLLQLETRVEELEEDVNLRPE